MHYINPMPLSFKSMANYINMWRDVLINEILQELGNLAHHNGTWSVEQAPPDLFEQF